jgi:hypothetical protein
MTGASATRAPSSTARRKRPTIYTEDGVYTARVIVRDNQGGTASAQASITVSTPNDPPVPEILSPAEGATFDAGVTVQVSGRALDPEDGELTGDKLLWDVILVHNEHTHPFVTGAKGASGSFDVPLAGIEEGMELPHRLHGDGFEVEERLGRAYGRPQLPAPRLRNRPCGPSRHGRTGSR